MDSRVRVEPPPPPSCSSSPTNYGFPFFDQEDAAQIFGRNSRRKKTPRASSSSSSSFATSVPAALKDNAAVLLSNSPSRQPPLDTKGDRQEIFGPFGHKRITSRGGSQVMAGLLPGPYPEPVYRKRLRSSGSNRSSSKADGGSSNSSSITNAASTVSGVCRDPLRHAAGLTNAEVSARSHSSGLKCRPDIRHSTVLYDLQYE